MKIRLFFSRVMTGNHIQRYPLS